MSRITDTERGARYALEISAGMVVAGDLFDNDPDLWASIYLASLETVREEQFCRAVMGEGDAK